jgi:hypothetical protein
VETNLPIATFAGMQSENIASFTKPQSGYIATFRRTQSGIIAIFSGTCSMSFLRKLLFGTEISQKIKFYILYSEEWIKILHI